MPFVSHGQLVVAAWNPVLWRVLESGYLPGKSDLIN